METVSVKYIAKQMLKYLWIAVLAGAVLAAAYVFLATKTETAAETDRVKRLTNYDGDYLSHPETKRFAIYRLVWEKDVVSQLTDAKWKIVDYSKELLSYIYQRLTSRAFSHMWYQELCKQFPEIKADQKRFSVSVIEKEMLGTGIEHCANLWIMIKAPLSLKEDEKPGYTDEQLCAYRDALYALVAETVESGALTGDLTVELQRVEPLVEDSVSEQGYVTGTLEDDAEDQRSISKKKILLVFILGACFVEGIVLSCALGNDKIHIQRGIDIIAGLTLISTLNKNSLNCEETVVKLMLKNEITTPLYLIPAGNTRIETERLSALLSEELRKAEKQRTGLSEQKQESAAVVPMRLQPGEWTAEILRLAGKDAILVAEENYTKNGEIRDMDFFLRQVGTNVIGVLVLTA